MDEVVIEGRGIGQQKKKPPNEVEAESGGQEYT